MYFKGRIQDWIVSVASIIFVIIVAYGIGRLIFLAFKFIEKMAN